jgi:hypothetical protein
MAKFVAEIIHNIIHSATVTVEVPDGAEDAVIEEAIQKHVADERAKAQADQSIEWVLDVDEIEIEGYDEE